MKNIFKSKIILVTGGTGSIGSEIVRQLLKKGPKTIRVLSRHEEGHHQLMHELAGEEEKMRFIIGDIRDRERLALAMEGVDIVFHAAALKHVPLCEYNPFEAVKTNIVGTQNVIEAARSAGASHVIGISTDKVAEPESVLGVSKLMGSRGSILSLIKSHIDKGQPIPITDPNMTRFFMTVPEAVSLVLHAALLGKGQEIFVLKMPAAQLSDVVQAGIAYFAPAFGKKPFEIATKIIGKRRGEKMHEKLLADHEVESALETKEMYILTPSGAAFSEYTAIYPASRVRKDDKRFSSKFARKLTLKELRGRIEEVDRNHFV